MSIDQIAALVIISNAIAFTAGFLINKKGTVNLEKEVQDYIIEEETRVKEALTNSVDEVKVGSTVYLASVKSHLIAFIAKIKSKL